MTTECVILAIVSAVMLFIGISAIDRLADQLVSVERDLAALIDMTTEADLLLSERLSQLESHLGFPWAETQP